MSQSVTAIFDIGKTNKKLLLFNQQFEVVYEHEEKFEETVDEDGFPCDDLDRIEKWMKQSINDLAKSAEYDLKAVNFTTYGATVVFIGENGERIAPLYNYLKTIPEDITAEIYNKYGGKEEFSRKTASPAWGMLNTGMQIYWIKKAKPELFSQVKYILNFPQYLSYLFTGKIAADYTYIGCHTATWDFDRMQYHSWLKQESIRMDNPVSSNTAFPVTIQGKEIKIGVGLHDSSASLVPYLKESKEPFILCSTGTWILFMNPFNTEPLTIEQLQNNCLCYLTTERKQVKSSLLFLGYVHDVNVERLTNHFKVSKDAYKKVVPNPEILTEPTGDFGHRRIFFVEGLPQNHTDESVELSQFNSFEEAYHRLMTDLTQIAWEGLQSVIPADDKTTTIFVSGGFNRNTLFIQLLSQWLPDKKIIASNIKNATAFGAAMIIND
jgi:sugar (pentulose or hexulose) kinase